MRSLIILSALALSGCSTQTKVAVAPTPVPVPTVAPAPTIAPVVIQSNEPPPPAMGGPIDTPSIVANSRNSRAARPRQSAPVAAPRSKSISLMTSYSLREIDNAQTKGEVARLSLKFHGNVYDIEDQINEAARQNDGRLARRLSTVKVLYEGVANYADTKLAIMEGRNSPSALKGARYMPMEMATRLDKQDGVTPMELAN